MLQQNISPCKEINIDALFDTDVERSVKINYKGNVQDYIAESYNNKLKTLITKLLKGYLNSKELNEILNKKDKDIVI